MKIKTILVDSNVLIAFYLPTDPQHEKAKKLIKSSNKNLKVVNEYLLSEIATVILVRGKDLPLATRVATDLLNGTFPGFSMLPTNQKLNEKTLEIFSRQENGKLSFADCSIVAQAELQKVEIIATFDRKLRKSIKNKFQLLPDSF